MSIYGKATCQMTDLERLQEAIGMAGLGDRVKVYPNGDGVYRKFSGKVGCAGGYVRGRDAHLVIHGGLDNSGRYRDVPEGVGGTGDTAFILEPDGSVRVELDVNWYNAKTNWELVQNWYAAIGIQKRAKAAGQIIDLTVDEKTGKITGRVIQERPTASRTKSRRVTSRPQAARPQARR